LCYCKPKRSDEAAQLLTEHFRAGQKQAFRRCVLQNYFLKLPLCRTCAAKLLPKLLQSFYLKQKTNSLTPNAELKGEPRSGESSEQRERL
jgi:hypothetical protein